MPVAVADDHVVEDADPQHLARGNESFGEGDILVGLHQWETLSLENVNYVLNHPDLLTFNPMSFFILRAGQVRKGDLTPIN